MSTSCGWEGKGRYGLFRLQIKRMDVQVQLCYPLTMRAIPALLRDASCGGANLINYLYLFTFTRVTHLDPRCNPVFSPPN